MKKFIKFTTFVLSVILFASKCDSACVTTTLDLCMNLPSVDISSDDPNVIEAAKFALKDYLPTGNTDFLIEQVTVKECNNNSRQFHFSAWCTGCIYGYQECQYTVNQDFTLTNEFKVVEIGCVL